MDSRRSKRPNVIWIVADQMRAQAMSHRGDPNVSTPNLDRMAIEGVNFTHAVSGTPLCCPFRGSMLTGRYPHRSSVPALNSPLSTDAVTVAHAFNQHGYRTAYIGKWHVDGNRPGMDLAKPENRKETRYIPRERRGGFVDWWAYENNNQPFHCYVHTDGQDGEPVSFRLPGYETDALTDLFIGWLRDRTELAPEQPFFGVLSVQPPHDPYVAPAEDMARHRAGAVQLAANVPPVAAVQERARAELAGYYAAIERVDFNVGRVRDELRALGIDQNTYVMFFSDHGDMHGSHGQFRKMAPWEEAIRVPLLISGPTRKSYKPQVCDGLVNHVDIAPTSLGLCGIEPPTLMEGFDYSPWIISGAAAEEGLPDSAYISLPVPTALQSGLIAEEGVDRPFRGVVTRDGWKYVALEGQPWLMFNLREDPLEMVNLSHNVFYKEERRQLQQRLQQWIHDTEDSFLLPDS